MAEQYKSRVYTDRPDYADFDPPAKFVAIQSIIAERLKQKEIQRLQRSTKESRKSKRGDFMKRTLEDIGTVSTAMQALMLAMCAGAGVELRGWIVWYLFALAFMACGGLCARMARNDE